MFIPFNVHIYFQCSFRYTERFMVNCIDGFSESCDNLCTEVGKLEPAHRTGFERSNKTDLKASDTFFRNIDISYCPSSLFSRYICVLLSFESTGMSFRVLIIATYYSPLFEFKKGQAGRLLSSLVFQVPDCQYRVSERICLFYVVSAMSAFGTIRAWEIGIISSLAFLCQKVLLFT